MRPSWCPSWTVLASVASVSVACTPPSRWADTRAVCGFPDEALDAGLMAGPPRYPSEWCVDAVLADFDVDRAAMLAWDGLDDPYGLVHGDAESTAVAALLWAAHALLTVDLGTIADARGSWVTPAFLRELADLGDPVDAPPIAALLYDYVAREVRTTAPGWREDASAGLQGRTLWLYDLPGGIDGAAVLVHEARHRAGPDHLWCRGEQMCDVDETGSVGFEIAVHELARDAAQDEAVAELQQYWIDALSERVLAR